MIQAARSGKQNIVEGSRNSVTSKKSELKLIGVSRCSLEELLEDYRDFVRQNGLKLWAKDDPKAIFIRKLYSRSRSDQPDSSETYSLYKPYIEEKSRETAANTLICLINQANYLLDQLIRRLERDFVDEGGFTERLYAARLHRRSGRSDRSDGSDDLP